MAEVVVDQPQSHGIEDDIITVIFNILQEKLPVPRGQDSHRCAILS